VADSLNNHNHNNNNNNNNNNNRCRKGNNNDKVSADVDGINDFDVARTLYSGSSGQNSSSTFVYRSRFLILNSFGLKFIIIIKN
jgi:hypothetical protein